MRRLIALLTIAALFFTSSFKVQKENDKSNSLKGAWQLFDNSSGGNSGPARFIKVFHDSTFTSYALTDNGAVIFVEGTYKIVNDSLYNETVTQAVNQTMEGRTNRFKYNVKGKRLSMSGIVNAQSGGTADILESWIRVDFPAKY